MNENAGIDGYLAGYMNKTADAYWSYSGDLGGSRGNRKGAAEARGGGGGRARTEGERILASDKSEREVIRGVPATRASKRETEELKNKINPTLKDTNEIGAETLKAKLDTIAQGVGTAANYLPILRTFPERVAVDGQNELLNAKDLVDQQRILKRHHKDQYWWLQPEGLKEKYQFGKPLVESLWKKDWEVSPATLEGYHRLMNTPKKRGMDPAERGPAIRNELESRYNHPQEQLRKLKKLQDMGLLMSSNQNQQRGQAYA